MLVHIFIGTHEDLLVLRRPRPILVLGPIDTGLVAAVLGFRRQFGRGRLTIYERFPVPVEGVARSSICSISGAGSRWNRTWWLKCRVHR